MLSHTITKLCLCHRKADTLPLSSETLYNCYSNVCELKHSSDFLCQMYSELRIQAENVNKSNEFGLICWAVR